MSHDARPNYLQEIVYALFLRACPNISDVESFSKEKSINFNTLRDFYYKKGKAGVSTINEILCALLDLNQEKVHTIVDSISNLGEPTECDIVWNAIDLPPDKKLYYAQVAKAVYDLDQSLEDID